MAKKDEIKKIVPKNQEVTKYDFVICPNCGTEEVGKYCPNCGQSNKDYNKPIKDVFEDLLDSINLDIRLINTLIPFFTKPGFLAQEYFRGRRKRYVPPIRMYMFVSIIFFFLAQSANIDQFSDIGKVSLDDVADSTNIIIDKGLSDKDTSTVKTFKDLSTSQKEEIRQEIATDSIPEIIKKGFIGGLNASEKADIFYDKFLKNVSYVLFLLMPFFAAILALTLWKSKKLYVHHLIFSVNFHSFIFGLSSILILLSKVSFLHINEMASYLLWGYPLYLMFGIKRFYERSYVASFFKTIGITLLYLFIIFIVVIVILAVTASIFYKG